LAHQPGCNPVSGYSHRNLKGTLDLSTEMWKMRSPAATRHPLVASGAASKAKTRPATVVEAGRIQLSCRSERFTSTTSESNDLKRKCQLFTSDRTQGGVDRHRQCRN
jgi:hypothetical protein